MQEQVWGWLGISRQGHHETGEFPRGCSTMPLLPNLANTFTWMTQQNPICTLYKSYIIYIYIHIYIYIYIYIPTHIVGVDVCVSMFIYAHRISVSMLCAVLEFSSASTTAGDLASPGAAVRGTLSCSDAVGFNGKRPTYGMKLLDFMGCKQQYIHPLTSFP